jgi:hypothetical protein
MSDIQKALAQYTADEKRALRGLFDIYDRDGSGYINDYELKGVMQKVGRSTDNGEAEKLLETVDPDKNGKISFEEFLFLLTKGQADQQEAADGIQPDQKVLEFLRILDEYRIKCEKEGNYMEAERATKQLATLRKQEERRQGKSMRAKQIAERQDVQIAHNMQYAEFNAAWDKYMEEYDQMAQMYIQQMTEKHRKDLSGPNGFQQRIAEEITSKPLKFSKELLNWRRRQHLLAKQKNYAEAQKLKRLADKLEKKEKKKLQIQHKQAIAKREAKFRAEQQKELAALLKRIDGRRKEHLKQRNDDSKRLLQRNRNVQQVLESKQAVQLQRQQAMIRSSLNATSKSRRRVG